VKRTLYIFPFTRYHCIAPFLFPLVRFTTDQNFVGVTGENLTSPLGVPFAKPPCVSSTPGLFFQYRQHVQVCVYATELRNSSARVTGPRSAQGTEPTLVVLPDHPEAEDCTSHHPSYPYPGRPAADPWLCLTLKVTKPTNDHSKAKLPRRR
jgi:hypothetical protein